MSSFSFFRYILLFLLVMVIGLYAGMHFFHEMCPVETQMTPLEYAKYWKIVDGTFMHKRMGVMGPVMMMLFIVNIIMIIKSWKSIKFLLLALSWLAFLADVTLTVTQQLPINEYINALDLNVVTMQQLAQLESFQTQAIDNFEIRFICSMVSFALVCAIPFCNLLSTGAKLESKHN